MLFLEHLHHDLTHKQRQRLSQHLQLAAHHLTKFDLKLKQNQQLINRRDKSTDQS